MPSDVAESIPHRTGLDVGMETMLEVNGTRLFVDDRGPADGQPLLFIHGGPGNSCWDFMTSVGDVLANGGLRVIGIDQRGVLRSDDLPPDPPLTVDLLIRDFEAVRHSLKISRWTIVGHSAGGGYALDYALSHPDVVAGVIFDCPCLDADATDRHRLPKAARRLDQLDNHAAAEACRHIAAKSERITADDRSWEPMRELGEHYADLFLYDGASHQVYAALMDSASAELDWRKGMSHQPLLADMYRQRTRLLDHLAVRSVLIHGSKDLVAAPAVIAAYQQHTDGRVVTIDRAGHFPYIEQPDSYSRAVLDFVSQESLPG